MIPAKVDRLIGALVRTKGYRRAGYFLSEDAAAVLDTFAGHHPRRVASLALLAGQRVTIDLGQSAALSHDGERCTVVLTRGALTEVAS